ncbi:MAG: aminotransferase class I/II-fold pyridoxal phosphate-dependent enzyme [Silicimonas sp.]|nr:aminotransferase class I/II-fold pyridoxal phosphate-dependent enzyme [Silicimonas sp.]
MSIPRAHSGIDNIKPHMVGLARQSVPPAAIALNSNESAFGPSPYAREAARAASASMERYVENVDSILSPAIAEAHGLDVNRITCGQGSDDLIARLVRGYLGPGLALMRSANGYLKVPNYAHQANGAVIHVPDNNFTPSVDNMIAALNDSVKIVYLANPENPAGTYLTGQEVRQLHAAMPNHALMILDCAYEEYVDAPDYEPGHRLVRDASNVVTCRTFSKIHGLAGARVGWVYGPEDVIDTAKCLALTFPIATPSLAAALAALEDKAHTDFVRRENARLRTWLILELAGLGLNTIASQTNFVLIHMPDPGRSAEALDTALRSRGVALRRMASPAYRDHIRITIGFQHELQRALELIDQFVRGEI